MKAIVKTAFVAATALALLPSLAWAVPTANNQSISMPPNLASPGKLISLSYSGASGTVTITIVSKPAHGTLTPYNSSYPQYYYYLPAAGYQGPDSFTWKVTDSTGTSNTATYSITVANTVPKANNQAISVSENAVRYQFNLSYSDPDGQPLTFTLVSAPAHGSLEAYVYENGAYAWKNVTVGVPVTGTYNYRWYYTAQAGYTGTDSFTWKLNDGMVDSNVATCSVSVNVNTPPTANNSSISVNCGQQTSVYLSKTDPDAGQSYTYTLVSPPAHGTVAMPAPSTGSAYAYYTSANNYLGSDSFKWKCNDGKADSNTATVTITVNGVPPVPQDQVAAVIKDAATDMPAVYTGGGGYTLAFVKETSPSYGTLTVNGDTFHYVPKAGWTGTTSFKWHITYSSASTPATNTATVTFTIKVMEDGGADWPMWRMDAQRSGVTTRSLPESLHLQWRRDLPAIAPGFMSNDTRYEYCHEPVVLGKTMFVASSRNDLVLALNTDTGAERWRFYAEGPVRTAPAAARLASGHERLYVASDDGNLYCLNAADGSLVWKKRGGPSVRKMLGFDRLIATWPCMASPVVDDGKVYFTAGLVDCETSFVYALDAETGSVVWLNDSSLGHSYGVTVPNGAIVPLGTGGTSTGELLGPSPQGYPVIKSDGTELFVPTGWDAPGRYYLDTGILKYWYGASKNQNPAIQMWLDENCVTVGARPVGITAGSRTYTAADAVALGASGTVYTLIAADNKLFAVTSQGSIYCFGGTQVTSPPAHTVTTTPLPNTSDSWTTAVSTMLSQSGVNSGTGVSMVWGTGSGRLVEELIKQSNLIVEGFDPSATKCAALRAKLDAAGLYGFPGPSGMHVGSPLEQGFPPTLARLIAVEDLSSSGYSAGVDFAKKLYRALRPNGGQGWLPTTSSQHSSFVSWVQQAGLQEAAVSRVGEWTVLTRTGVPGGLANVVRPPFGVLWFGDRNSSLHNRYSGGAQKCITLDGVGGGYTNDGTAPTGDDPGPDTVNPLTGLSQARSIFCGYGCAGQRDQGNIWVARSGVLAVYDKWRDSGTIHLVNARPTCDASMGQYSDGTVFLYGPGCLCAYAFRGSFAFVPMDEEEVQEQWAAWEGHGRWSNERIDDVPLRGVGLNFGGLGCVHPEGGPLWVAYPQWSDNSPSLPVEFTPADPERFYHHASRIAGGDGPKWVAGSGVKGVDAVTIGLAKTALAVQTSAAPTINGLLTDGCWNGASPVYMSHDAEYGVHRSAQAFVRYDSQKLYIGLRKDGDYAGSDEAFDVYLSGRNTLNAKGIVTTYLRYRLNASGERVDVKANPNATSYLPPVEDPAWEGTWQGAVSADAARFAAEMAIPWSELADNGIDRDQLLVNICGPEYTRIEALSLNGAYYDPGTNRPCERFVPLYLGSARGAISVARPYRVRLHFAEIFDVPVGGRVFDVKLQGQTVLSNFDIRAAANGRNRSVVREFNLNITDKLDIAFVRKAGEPLICGVELVNETANGANVPPVADAKAFPASGAAPLATVLSAVDSYDLNDAALKYRWEFGDGEVGEGREAPHTYFAGGTYTARLTVTDPAGATATDTVQVVATGAGNQPPVCSLASPLDGAVYAEPAKVVLTAVASDSDGIAKVVFCRDGVVVFTDTASPYTYNMYNVPAGSYRFTAVAYDTLGAYRTSAPADITVGGAANAAPVISGFSPASPAVVAAGTSQPFAVDAWDADGDVLSYVWKLDGGSVGVSGSAMTYSPTTADAGSHSIEVTVTDGKGGSVKQTWSVTVTAASVAPSITTQPVSKAVTVGQTATFIVAATGTAPLSYQWQKNGVNISGATAASYTTPAAVAADSGAKFRVTVTNSVGSVTSSEATLTVNKATPTITWATPAPITYGTALSATQLNATASVPGTFVYTPGAGTVLAVGSHTLTAAFTPTDTTNYNTASKSVTLVVNSAAVAPSITTQPASKTVTVGQTATFSVVAAGTAPLSYQWQKNGTNISGATSASYTTPATTTAENGAKFKVTVTNTAGSVTSSEATLTVNPAPSDLPVVTLTAYDAWAAEPSSDTGRFRLYRSNCTTTAALTVKYTMSGLATNGSDYQSLTGSVTIAAGSRTAYVYVTPKDDTLVEGAETVTMTLSSDAAYVPGSPDSATVALLDNETPIITVSAGDAYASESGGDTGSFRVARSGSTVAAVTVKYTVSGTATNGTDYQALTGSVVVPAGKTSAYVYVTALDDSLTEDMETVVLTLSDDASYQVGKTSVATVNLLDDEMPILTVKATDAVAAEPSADKGTFTITRSGKLNVALTVTYKMTGAAKSGTDYAAPSGTVTLASGVTTATVTISPIDDTAVEGRESVTLAVLSSSAYQLGWPYSATLCIYDDEKPYVSIKATDTKAYEAGLDPGEFTVSCVPAAKVATAVVLAITGTATPGSDYQALPATVTIAAGASSAKVAVKPLDDAASEGSESVQAALASGTTYQVGSPSSATVYITSNE